MLESSSRRWPSYYRIRVLARQSHFQVRLASLDRPGAFRAVGPDPVRHFNQRELSRRVREAVARLPETEGTERGLPI